jgi:hypothetical protein
MMGALRVRAGETLHCSRPPHTTRHRGVAMLQPPATSAPQDRHCGRCTACCTRLAIPEGIVGADPKPAGTPCTWLQSAGCQIYARRPKVCVRFACAWLRDKSWPAGWRPDRCGLMCLRELLELTTPAAAVYEIRPQALRRPEAARLLAVLQQTTAAVAIIGFQGQRHRLPGSWSTPTVCEPVPLPNFAACPTP